MSNKYKNLFIIKANKKHQNKFDYSKVVYNTLIKKVIIICPFHGEFKQTPTTHLRTNGCPKCSKNYKLDNTSFKTKANKIHGNKYDYSLVEYKNNKIKIKIICSQHGIFNQRPDMHLNGQGCPECKKIKLSTIKKYDNEKLISIFKKIHGDKYNYDVNTISYKSYDDYVNITCPTHGLFKQTPHRHISGKGCKKCAIDKLRNTKKIFSEKSSIIHYNKYDYSLVEYKNNKTKVEIICPSHGIFRTKPISHLNGDGCPRCKMSKGEIIVFEYLKSNNIEYIYQKKFKDCVFVKQLIFDFFLPNRNLCIEVDGQQHREIIEFFGGESEFLKLKEKDKIKTDYCKSKKIELLRINNTDSILTILEDKFK